MSEQEEITLVEKLIDHFFFFNRNKIATITDKYIYAVQIEWRLIFVSGSMSIYDHGLYLDEIGKVFTVIISKDYFNKLLKKYPDHFIVPAVYMSIGRVLTSMGKEESAKKEYQKILDFHPTSAWVPKAKEEIEGPEEELTPPAPPQIEIKPEAKKEEAPEEEKTEEATEKAPEVQPQEAESAEEKAE